MTAGRFCFCRASVWLVVDRGVVDCKRKRRGCLPVQYNYTILYTLTLNTPRLSVGHLQHRKTATAGQLGICRASLWLLVSTGGSHQESCSGHILARQTNSPDYDWRIAALRYTWALELPRAWTVTYTCKTTQVRRKGRHRCIDNSLSCTAITNVTGNPRIKQQARSFS